MSERTAPSFGRPMGVLLAGILLFHAGWYMLLPFLAILFTERRGYTPAQVGTVMAVQSITLVVGSLLGGVLADRHGRRLTMITGLIIRTVGVAGLGFTGPFGASLGTAAIAGLGGGLYGPAAKAAIATLATGQDQARAFSWRGIAANVGTSLGPLVGTWLIRGPMQTLFIAAAALHTLLALATWLLLPEQPRLSAQVHQPWRGVLTDTPFLAFSIVTVLAWALFAQLAIAVPLYASRVLGLGRSVGLIWTITSLAVITLQVPVTRWVLARLRPLTAMAWGALLLGVGLGLVGMAHSFSALLGAVLLFVAGEMLLLPTADTMVSALARPELIGAYFGVASLSWGLGEAIGNATGGAMMQFALRGRMLALPWLTYLITGLIIAALYTALRRVSRLGQANPFQSAAKTAPVVYRPGYPTADESVRSDPTGQNRLR